MECVKEILTFRTGQNTNYDEFFTQKEVENLQESILAINVERRMAVWLVIDWIEIEINKMNQKMNEKAIQIIQADLK